jgi:DNA-binding PadR family transcriptional regulator
MAVATRDAAGLSTTEFAVLGLLTFGEQSGYELKKAAEAGVGYVWTAAKSQIYAVLPRLVADGFATSRRVEQDRRPDKQVYRITKRGRQAFHDWLQEPIEERAGVRSPLMLKLFFGAQMPVDVLAAHIERKREVVAEELADYRRIEAMIRDSERDYFGYVTLRWGLADTRAWLRWADKILAELEARR